MTLKAATGELCPMTAICMSYISAQWGSGIFCAMPVAVSGDYNGITRLCSCLAAYFTQILLANIKYQHAL